MVILSAILWYFQKLANLDNFLNSIIWIQLLWQIPSTNSDEPVIILSIILWYFWCQIFPKFDWLFQPIFAGVPEYAVIFFGWNSMTFSQNYLCYDKYIMMSCETVIILIMAWLKIFLLGPCDNFVVIFFIHHQIMENVFQYPVNLV